MDLSQVSPDVQALIGKPLSQITEEDLKQFSEDQLKVIEPHLSSDEAQRLYDLKVKDVVPVNANQVVTEPKKGIIDSLTDYVYNLIYKY